MTKSLVFAATLFLVTVFTLTVACPAAENPTGASERNGLTAEYADWQFDGYAELPEIPEPSGMCYHPERDSLFIVDDGGFTSDGSFRKPAVFELSLELEMLNKRELGDDLEGICWCSWDGMLYVTDEADEQVFIVDPDGLSVMGDFYVSVDYDGKELLTQGGNGFEGIEYIPGNYGEAGYFILLNQDDPHALVRIEYVDIPLSVDGKKVPIHSYHLLPEINLGELYYDAGTRELWVIHSWMNVMEVLDIDSLDLKRWEVVPGASQEALTLDGQGRLWIGYDLGGISRYVMEDR